MDKQSPERVVPNRCRSPFSKTNTYVNLQKVSKHSSTCSLQRSFSQTTKYTNMGKQSPERVVPNRCRSPFSQTNTYIHLQKVSEHSSTYSLQRSFSQTNTCYRSLDRNQPISPCMPTQGVQNNFDIPDGRLSLNRTR